MPDSAPEPLPMRQFDLTDAEQVGAWLADMRVRHPGAEEFDEAVSGVVARLGREYQKVAAALKAKGRGQRGGGSEAYGSQETIPWAERAEERAEREEPSTPAEGSAAGADSAASSSTDADPAAQRNRGHRQPFPASWPRERVDLPVAAELRACPVCGKDKVCIGHEVSEILAIKPAELYVKQVHREKLACADGHVGVVTAPPLPRLVEQSSCDLSISLDLLDRKLCQHLPIHRIVDLYARRGCAVAEKTLERWYHDGLRALHVVACAIRSEARAKAGRFMLNIDDTSIPILDRETPEGRLIGHLWLVVGDQRFVAATVSKDWKKEHAMDALGDWRGYVQCDAYRGFDAIFRKGTMVEVGCWAHARRYFVKAKDRGDKLAEEALGLIGRLYAVEAEATRRELDAEGRLALRRERSRRALDLLWKWQAKVGARARPKSPLGKGLTYLTNQRQALERFLEDGRLPIDNMAVEREMRPVALGRKNWLFAGNFEAAERLADGLTVIATARMHGVDPVAYLGWLLPQLGRREWSVEAARAHLLPAHFQQTLEQSKADAVG